MLKLKEDIEVTENDSHLLDDYGITLGYGDDIKMNTRRLLEARLEDIKLRRELDDHWQID